MSNRELAKKAGFRKFLPVSHYYTRSEAEHVATYVSRNRKSVGKDIKVINDGGAFAVVTRSKRQLDVARRALKHRDQHSGRIP